jgi:predicted peroxiredoxin
MAVILPTSKVAETVLRRVKSPRTVLELACLTLACVVLACGTNGAAEPGARPGNAVSNRIFIMLTQGPDPANQTAYTETDLWKINLAVSLANRALVAGRPTTLFLDVHAPAIARKDLSPTLQFKTEPPIKTQLSQFLAKGGTVMICPLCAGVMGVQPDEVIPGVIFGDSGIFGPQGLAPGTASLSF